MQNNIENILKSLNIELPQPVVPVANYVPYVVSGNFVFLSGQLPMKDGTPQYIGKAGKEFNVEEAQVAARLCAINLLSQLRAACGGDLDRVKQCVRLGIFVNSAEDFIDQPKVANGASDLMVDVFGAAGKHARAAVGVNTLPLGVCVEVDGVFIVE